MTFGDLQDENWKLGIWQGKAFNPTTQEAETRLQVQDQPETLSQKQTRKNQAIAICKLSYDSLGFILILSSLFHCFNHPRFGSHGHCPAAYPQSLDLTHYFLKTLWLDWMPKVHLILSWPALVACKELSVLIISLYFTLLFGSLSYCYLF